MIVYASLYRAMKDGALVVNPAPVDPDTPEAPWLAERAILMGPELQACGIAAWLWPPLTMSQGGTAANADGYGKQNDLNVGQFVGRPTRWGRAQQVLLANRNFHRLGMLALEDAVIHQYAGNYPFYELGEDGRIDRTLFPKNANCFVPNVPVDDVFNAEGNAAFGQMVSYQHSQPPGYMLEGTIESMQWRRNRLCLDGGRLDDTKGEAVTVSRQMIGRVGGFWFGEMFDGNPDEEERWVEETGGKNTLDFTLHWALQGICDGGVSLRSLPGNGLYARDAEHAVLFVDSADTDLNNGENIKFNKLWAYLLIMTLPARAAEIYGGDYEKYGLALQIRQICWTATTFAIGALRWEHVEDNLIVWSRDGDGGKHGWSGGLVCGFSRDTAALQRRWVRTPFGPGQHLHDYLGHGPELWTNGDGWVELQLGPNVNGSANNGVMYARAGVERKIPIVPVPDAINGSLFDFTGIVRRAL